MSTRRKNVIPRLKAQLQSEKVGTLRHRVSRGVGAEVPEVSF